MAKQPYPQDDTIPSHGSSRLIKIRRSICKHSQPLFVKTPPSFGSATSCRKGRTRVTHPVIIHTFEPEVIIAEPGEFMQVVQRLTGSWSSTGRRSRSTSAQVSFPRSLNAEESLGKGGLPFGPSSPSSLDFDSSVNVNRNGANYNYSSDNLINCNISNPPDNTVRSTVSPECVDHSNTLSRGNYGAACAYHTNLKPTLGHKNVKDMPSSSTPVDSDLIRSPRGDSTDMSTGYTSPGASTSSAGTSNVEEAGCREAADDGGSEEVNFFVFSLDSYYGTMAPQDDDWQEL